MAVAVVPEMADLSGGGWARAEEIVETTLAERPPAVRRQLRLFLRLLNWMPFPLYLRTFRSLDPRRRILFLERLERAPLLKLRQGFWGLRTLVLMGYYGQPENHRRIGSRAHPRGRRARGSLDPETGREVGGDA